ncbi:anti-sigma factor [Pusillimonas sp. SM2304]|uniref:anti-sigma factor n=1 Tax=Pusillimonas sp. SM2304 TaxID=3073241 RepID=UPI002875352D|nr:anti-sigma factor [Pusillimonas sp. SM2304]MDS1141673.1 anti-sigma factor [Pusillimonas sp. SM2304]
MTGSTKPPHSALLGEYTLGLLSPVETAQAHALLGQDQQAVATALAWENRLLELTDFLPPVDPSPLLLQRIQSSLGHDTTPKPASLYRKPASDTPPTLAAAPPAPAGSTSPRPSSRPAPEQRPAPSRPAPVQAIRSAAATPIKRIEPSAGIPPAGTTAGSATSAGSDGAPVIHIDRAARTPPAAPEPAPVPQKKRGNIWFWRLASLVFALIALALGLMPAQPVAPPITVLQVAPTQAAILQAPGQSSTPAWVVTVDPQRNVLMSPKVHSDIPADAAVQLWTHNRSMPAPRSLGLIDPNQPVTVPAALMGDIGPDQIFEMTLEPAGGSPIASPSGPVLFIGRIVTFGKPAQADTEAALANRPPH